MGISTVAARMTEAIAGLSKRHIDIEQASNSLVQIVMKHLKVELEREEDWDAHYMKWRLKHHLDLYGRSDEYLPVSSVELSVMIRGGLSVRVAVFYNPKEPGEAARLRAWSQEHYGGRPLGLVLQDLAKELRSELRDSFRGLGSRGKIEVTQARPNGIVVSAWLQSNHQTKNLTPLQTSDFEEWDPRLHDNALLLAVRDILRTEKLSYTDPGVGEQIAGLIHLNAEQVWRSKARTIDVLNARPTVTPEVFEGYFVAIVSDGNKPTRFYVKTEDVSAIVTLVNDLIADAKGV